MKIEESSKIEKNGKTYYKLKIDGKAFTAFDSSEAFGQLERGEVKAGYEAKVLYNESPGSFQGRSITYRNINVFEDIKEGEVSNNSGSMSKEEWLEKDVRIVRQSCLSRAIEFFEMNKERLDIEGLVNGQAVINQAKQFEEYVWSKKGDEE